MKKKFLIILTGLLMFGNGAWLGFYIRSQTINPRATLPNIFERTANFLVRIGEKEDDDLLYHNTDLADFIINGSAKTKVSVEGIVDNVTQQPDGDYHIILRPQYVPAGLYLVTEAIPEIKLQLPKKGDRIAVWGIVRFDILHNWWELHPVIGWKTMQ